MSVQFGTWNFDGCPSSPNFLERAAFLLAPYGPDAFGSLVVGGLSFAHWALHTNRESHSERQPHRLPSGAILTWDGRLDNRGEMIRALGGEPAHSASDGAIVAASYNRWQDRCFPKLLGDWAMAIWNPQEATLTLARDFCGVRPLFYTLDDKTATWCSVLSPLVELSESPFALDQNYLAGWMVSDPSASRTPFAGICAVPPASYVSIKNRRATTRIYWRFDSEKRITHKSDARYEEHFRVVFAEAVRRRMRSEAPVLAELSGGMDSSSIVCVADRLLAEGRTETPRLDTVSYYSNAEPNWNERPYFEKVEELRGQEGCHIDVGDDSSFPQDYPRERLVLTPGACRRETKASMQFTELLTTQGNRVLLSGIGGDEVLGGVPAPCAELADLLVTAHARSFFRRLVAWALVDRTPVFHLAAKTAGLFLPSRLRNANHHEAIPSWFETDFVRRHRSAMDGQRTRLRIFGPLPSFQKNVETLEALRAQVGQVALSSTPPYEKRYPFLDRDLLEFLYAIPREQLLRPGQRRSLMRRALVGVVPEEIINRKRKAFVVRTPMAHLSSKRPRLLELTSGMVSAELGIVNARKFRDVLERAHRGREVHLVHVFRTLTIEYWLRHLRDASRLVVPSVSRLQSVAAQLPDEPVAELRGVR